MRNAPPSSPHSPAGPHPRGLRHGGDGGAVCEEERPALGRLLPPLHRPPPDPPRPPPPFVMASHAAVNDNVESDVAAAVLEFLNSSVKALEKMAPPPTRRREKSSIIAGSLKAADVEALVENQPTARRIESNVQYDGGGGVSAQALAQREDLLALLHDELASVAYVRTRPR